MIKLEEAENVVLKLLTKVKPDTCPRLNHNKTNR
jgi:hypothetical protein